MAILTGVLDVCQHFASYSGCVVKVQGIGINVYVFSPKTYARKNTRRWWARATAQEAYNTGRGVVSSHAGKACALPKLQGPLLLIFSSSAVNFVKVSLARLETLTRLSE